MFDMFAEVYIEGSVWSDFSDLIGRDIQYYDHKNNVVNGVVQSLSVGDIWEATMSTDRGTFLDVYAEIDGVDGESVCVGMLNLFGRGWTWEQVDVVNRWVKLHGFSSITTPIRLDSLPNVPNHRRFFVVTDVNVWEGCYCSDCAETLSKEGESFVRKMDSVCGVAECCDACGKEIPSRLDVDGLQRFLEDAYLNVQVSLDQTKLTIVFTPEDRMGWDCRDFRSYIYRLTTEKVSVSDVHSRFDSDCNEHFVHLTFDLGGE